LQDDFQTPEELSHQLESLNLETSAPTSPPTGAAASLSPSSLHTTYQDDFTWREDSPGQTPQNGGGGGGGNLAQASHNPPSTNGLKAQPVLAEKKQQKIPPPSLSTVDSKMDTSWSSPKINVFSASGDKTANGDTVDSGVKNGNGSAPLPLGNAVVSVPKVNGGNGNSTSSSRHSSASSSASGPSPSALTNEAKPSTVSSTASSSRNGASTSSVSEPKLRAPADTRQAQSLPSSVPSNGTRSSNGSSLQAGPSQSVNRCQVSKGLQLPNGLEARKISSVESHPSPSRSQPPSNISEWFHSHGGDSEAKKRPPARGKINQQLRSSFGTSGFGFASPGGAGEAATPPRRSQASRPPPSSSPFVYGSDSGTSL
jgi:hypothetical protein